MPNNQSTWINPKKCGKSKETLHTLYSFLLLFSLFLLNMNTLPCRPFSKIQHRYLSLPISTWRGENISSRKPLPGTSSAGMFSHKKGCPCWAIIVDKNWRRENLLSNLGTTLLLHVSVMMVNVDCVLRSVEEQFADWFLPVLTSIGLMVKWSEAVPIVGRV